MAESCNPGVESETKGSLESQAFRKHFGELCHAISDPEWLASELFSKGMISNDALDDTITTMGISRTYKTRRLLCHLMGTLSSNPECFQKFISTLKSSKHLEWIGNKVLAAYGNMYIYIIIIVFDLCTYLVYDLCTYLRLVYMIYVYIRVDFSRWTHQGLTIPLFITLLSSSISSSYSYQSYHLSAIHTECIVAEIKGGDNLPTFAEVATSEPHVPCSGK